MPRPVSTDSLHKFQRYRKARREKGMRLMRVWVPDTTSAGFAAEGARQAALLRGAAEESGALDFIEMAGDPVTSTAAAHEMRRPDYRRGQRQLRQTKAGARHPA